MKKIILLSLIFLPLILPAPSVNADTTFAGTIWSDTTWSPAGGVYILSGIVIVPVGVTLTIEPGTIIKAQLRATGFDVQGTLIAEGTESSPIYFTSFRDDSIGGDTNADGSATVPSIIDWRGITFRDGTSGNITHSAIRYAGEFNGIARAGVLNHGGNILLDHIDFKENFQPDIYQSAGSTTVTQSTFDGVHLAVVVQGAGGNVLMYGNSFATTTGIENFSPIAIDARNNWWGSPTGPRIASNPTGQGTEIYGPVLYDPWLGAPPNDTPPTALTPVIIVPGIMGSAYKNDELVIDPILHTYDDLIATLDANGYTPGVDLFTFPYEWRDSNVFSANLLDGKIEEVKSICNCTKVDLVAHSMGGLVARAYIQSVDYDGDVDQLVFLGTPHRGSADSYLVWEAGEFQPGFFNQLRASFIRAEALRNGYLNIFNYVHGRPILSVKELLPVFDYIKDKDSGILRIYPDNYPTNEFLENLNNNISSLLNSGVKITNIFGDTDEPNTITRIRVAPSDNGFWEHGKPDGFRTLLNDNGLERGAGDDAVTLYGVTIHPSILSNEKVVASHQRIPTFSANRIVQILTGIESTTNIDNGLNIDPKVLLLQLLSPIDVVVTAPDNKKIGKNFINGTEYNEIPGAFYSGFETDNEYITILNPLDGKYTIEVQGTGMGGEYGVLTSYVSDGVSITKETSGVTQPNQVTGLNVVVNNANPETIEPEKVVTSEVLLNDIIKSYELGWITDKKLKDNLVKKVEAIIKIEKKIEVKIEKLLKDGEKEKKIEKLETKIDKKAAKALLVELKGYQKDKINEEAYNIIKEDLEQLINN